MTLGALTKTLISGKWGGTNGEMGVHKHPRLLEGHEYSCKLQEGTHQGKTAPRIPLYTWWFVGFHVHLGSNLHLISPCLMQHNPLQSKQGGVLAQKHFVQRMVYWLTC